MTSAQPFEYLAPATLDDALAHLASPGTLPLGGGTDLLVQIHESLATPAAVVDLRVVVDGGVDVLDDGGLRIGAAARVHELARHPVVLDRWPALAQACEAVGTPALRHMGTIGGNLCQRPRCWYLRRNVPCLKNGGDGCPAKDGENQYHAILEGGPCWIVHPSDPAVALVALDAEIELASSKGVRTLPIGAFFVLPAERLDHETVLHTGEIVTALRLPAASAGGRQRYVKLMQREAWDFALASCAAVRRADDEVRLVLGGVAPRPYRVVDSVEEEVATGGLAEDDIETLADRALYDAAPLARNGYKVALAASLLRDAIRFLVD